MLIRKATSRDAAFIRRLYLEAFDQAESGQVAQLAETLLHDADTISLLAEKDGIIGHAAYSPVTLQATQAQIGLILSPLAIHPSYQNKGVGTDLVLAGIEQAAAEQLPLMFVYGDPAYYQRFGFSADTAKAYPPPCPMNFPHGWQAVSVTGTAPPQAGQLSCVSALDMPELW